MVYRDCGVIHNLMMSRSNSLVPDICVVIVTSSKAVISFIIVDFSKTSWNELYG